MIELIDDRDVIEMIDDEFCKLAEEPLILEEVRCLKIAVQIAATPSTLAGISREFSTT